MLEQTEERRGPRSSMLFDVDEFEADPLGLGSLETDAVAEEDEFELDLEMNDLLDEIETGHEIDIFAD